MTTLSERRILIAEDDRGVRQSLERTLRLEGYSVIEAKNGIEAHAGHGLTFDNVVPIAAIAQIRELNIGHFLIGEAIFDGLAPVVRRMRALMDEAR